MPAPASTSKLSKRDVVHLQYREKNGDVVVVPSDQDRFVLKVEQAIASCQLLIEVQHFLGRFNLLIKRLVEWLAQRQDVFSAWVTVRGGQFVFLVMKKKVEYDRGFEDDLTALELEVAGDSELCVIPMTTMALPFATEEALCSFVSPSMAFHFKSGDA